MLPAPAPSEREQILRLALASNFQKKPLSLPQITPVERDEQMPLSFAQQRLWFLAQMEGGSQAYHVPLRLELRGALDLLALGRALNRIVARHEALRTSFHQHDGEPLQRIAAVGDSHLTLLEHDFVRDPDRPAKRARLVELEAITPFNLQTGPLIRGRLIKMEDDAYTLLLTLHHIASDGWSIGLLAKELDALYGAFRLGSDDPLSPLGIQYADFAHWQRHWMAGDVYEQQRRYWTDQLQGLQPLQLPGDFPRPPVQRFRGATERFHVPPALTHKLQALSQSEGATLFMTLLAAFQVLLARYSGQDDIAVGTPVANRNRAEIEDLIGFFINTLVLRTQVSPSLSFRQLLRQVRTTCLGAYAHQDMPFEKLVQELHPERDLSRSPLFQVMFVLQNAVATTWTLGDVAAKRIVTDTQTARFDLSVELEQAGDGLTGAIEYSTDLFAAATVQRLGSQYVRLLEAIVQDEAEEVGRLPLLDATERHRIVSGWNDTRREYGKHKCVHEWIEEQAASTPEAIAVEWEDGSLSYGELNRRANRLGHQLRAQGIGPEQRVALFLERGWEMVVAVLGVLKSGAAYVPLDPDLPIARLHYMLTDSQPALLLTQGKLRERLEGAAVPVLEMDSEARRWMEAAEIAGINPETSALPGAQRGIHRLAYIIYTSGSTGQPKGVTVEHGGLTNRIAWMQEAYRLQPGVDAVLQKTPYGFDVSVWEFFWPLVSGARLVMARPEGHRDASYLIRRIDEMQITAMHFVPSMLAVFLEQLEREGDRSQCRSLRLLVSSGEALPGVLVQRTHRRLPRVALENLYGPTEATVDVTSWTCPPAFRGGPVPIGRPIANTQMYILDAHGEPVPVGVCGELHIGGIGVGRGYWKRPDLSAERFVPDSLGGESGARLYRTGDLARYLPDGAIEYLGRNDFQVKIRGFRIELGEIETRLTQHPGIGEAVVLAREDAPGVQHLVAYYVAAGTEPPSPGQLRSYLSDKLPEYMVPAAYVRLHALPLSPNGKLDRKALPSAGTAAFAQRDFDPPQGETETLLAGIWADVLKIEQVGREDNFFALGGHSLLATRVITRIRQTFEVEIALREVFTLPVLSALADRVLTVQLEQFNEADIALAWNQLQPR